MGRPFSSSPESSLATFSLKKSLGISAISSSKLTSSPRFRRSGRVGGYSSKSLSKGSQSNLWFARSENYFAIKRWAIKKKDIGDQLVETDFFSKFSAIAKGVRVLIEMSRDTEIAIAIKNYAIQKLRGQKSTVQCSDLRSLWNNRCLERF